MTDNGKRRGFGIHSKRLLTFVLNRRDFLKLAGVSASAVAAPGCDDGDATSSATSAELHIAEDLPFDFSLMVRRKEDFLALRFDFINFEPDGHFRSLRRKQAGPAFVIVNFPSQHLFEPAYFEGAADETPDPVPQLPIPTRLSGPSRVALTVPDAVDELPISLEGLLELDLLRHPVKLAGFAQGVGGIREVTGAAQGPRQQEVRLGLVAVNR